MVHSTCTHTQTVITFTMKHNTHTNADDFFSVRKRETHDESKRDNVYYSGSYIHIVPIATSVPPEEPHFSLKK